MALKGRGAAGRGGALDEARADACAVQMACTLVLASVALFALGEVCSVGWTWFSGHPEAIRIFADPLALIFSYPLIIPLSVLLLFGEGSACVAAGLCVIDPGGIWVASHPLPGSTTLGAGALVALSVSTVAQHCGGRQACARLFASAADRSSAGKGSKRPSGIRMPCAGAAPPTRAA